MGFVICNSGSRWYAHEKALVLFAKCSLMETSAPYQIPRELYLSMWTKRWILRPRFLLIELFFLCGAIFLFAFFGDDVFFGVVICLAFALLMPILVRVALKRTLRDNPTFTDRKTVSFDDQKLIAEGPNWKTELPWTYFRRFSESDDYLFLDMTRQGLGSIIPKTALTRDQIEKFRGYANKNVRRAGKA